MSKSRSALRNRVEDGAVAALLKAFGLLGPVLSERIGRGLGLAARAVLAPRRRLSDENIARAFPSLDAASVAALSRRTWAHFGGLFAGLVYDSQRPVEELLRRVEVVGWENARSASDAGRGVFFLTGHLGNWEIGALATAAQGIPSVVVARPLDNPLLDRRLTSFRESTGNRVVPKREAVRAMLRTLNAGGAIGIMPDQHVRPPDAVAVPFFGRPAATTTSVARLVAKTGALVVPVSCIRVGPARWRLEFLPAVDASKLPESEREVVAFTALVSRLSEELVRAHPEQWLWLHKRWRIEETEPGA